MQRFLTRLGEIRNGKHDANGDDRQKRQRVVDLTAPDCPLGFHSLPGTLHRYIVRFMDVRTMVACRRISPAWNALVGSTRKMTWMREVDLSVSENDDRGLTDVTIGYVSTAQWITTMWPLQHVFDFVESRSRTDLSQWMVIALARAHLHRANGARVRESVPEVVHGNAYDKAPVLRWKVTNGAHTYDLLQFYHRIHPTGIIHIEFGPGALLHYELAGLLLSNQEWILKDGQPPLRCGRFDTCKGFVLRMDSTCTGCNQPCCYACRVQCPSHHCVNAGQASWVCANCIHEAPGCGRRLNDGRRCEPRKACVQCRLLFSKCAFCNADVCGAECAWQQLTSWHDPDLESKSGVLGQRTCDTCRRAKLAAVGGTETGKRIVYAEFSQEAFETFVRSVHIVIAIVMLLIVLGGS